MKLAFWKQVGLACATVMLVSSAARADQADDLYRAVKTHVEQMKDYSLQYDYHGPRGDYKFDYRVVRNPPPSPSDVRTQVLQGPNSGAIILYRPSDRKDKAKAKKGLFTIWKDVNDDALKGTPMLASVFDMALNDTATSKPSLEPRSQVLNGHECYILNFANGNQFYVDKQSKDILKWTQPEANNTRDERTFYNIQVNTGAKMSL